MVNQVVYSNLFSESRNNVIALMTSSNVVDPLIPSKGARKWIYAREPDVKRANFQGFPYLIVHPADVDIEKEKGKGSLDGKSKMVFWDIEIEIVTSDRDYGDAEGKGLIHMDAVSDDVIQTFMGMTNRKTLSTNSMKFANVTTTAVTSEALHNKLVFRRSVLLSFESKIQVSA